MKNSKEESASPYVGARSCITAKSRKSLTGNFGPLLSIPETYGHPVQSAAPLNGIFLIRAFQKSPIDPISSLLLCYYDRFPVGSLTEGTIIAALEPVNGLEVSYRFSGMCSIRFFVGNRSVWFGQPDPSSIARQP